MKFKSCIAFILLFILVLPLKSQRANYWYFGANAGLNFNTTPPTVLTNGQANGPDNTTTISDGSGNLLFYTNGITVWNNLHAVMPNGSGLVGHTSAGQCALIVPVPCDPNKYVIFHVTEFSNPGYLNYTVVDMSLNGGLGDVITAQKNVSLGSNWTEKLCAYYDPGGNKYWLLSHKWGTDQFVAFEINSSSIATNSVVSAIGSIHSCGSYGAAHDAMGQLTISPDGTKVVNALTCQDKFELFDFNSSTGVVSNSISITGTGGNAWGTAFSPDSKRLYTNTIFGTSILQYDINTYTQAAILASQYSVVTVGSSGYNFGYMELGPDNKLYIAKPGTSTISVVNNPNTIGSGCNFSLTGQSLGIKISNHGMSRIAYNIPAGSTFSISASPSNSLGCLTQSLILTASPVLSSSSYTWSGPGIIGSINSRTIQVNTSGVYTCSLPTCTNVVSSLTFAVFSSTNTPTITTLPSLVNVCPGFSTSIAAFGASSYTWQPGGNTGSVLSITPSANVVYTVSGTSTLGCIGSTTVAVVLNPTPGIAISPIAPNACVGSIVSFTPSGALAYTLQPWGLSGGPGSTFTTLATTNTTYTLIGSGVGGCTASITGTVTVNPPPSLSISPVSNFACSNSTLTLTASGASTYTWFPGAVASSTLNVVTPLSVAVYTVIGTSAAGCTATAVKIITVIPAPPLNVFSTPTITCAGGTVTLSVNGATTYTWLPGGFSSSLITVNPLSTIIYTVNGQTNGCTSTATVLIGNPLSPTLSSRGNIDCNNSSVELAVSANSTTYTILWSGPGITGSASSPTTTVNAAGIYTVVITDTVTGCSASPTIAVLNTIGQLPINIIPSSTLTCYPGPPINMLVSTSANYSWFPSNQVTPSTGPLVSVNPSVTTVFTVLATQGVCTGSAAITISVNITPTVLLTSGNMTVCAGTSKTLSATGAESYLWVPGNLSGTNVTIAPVSQTIYTVTGISNNCSASDQLTVSVLPVPDITVTASPQVICVGDASTLVVSGAESLAWVPTPLPTPTAVIVVSPFTSTTFTALGLNSFGCTTTKTILVTVLAGSALSAVSSASLICSNESVSLTASGGTNYNWLPGNQTGNTIVNSPTVSTTYTVLASNTAGCKSFTTVSVLVQECITTVFGVTNAAEKPELYNGSFYKINFVVTAVNSSAQNLVNVLLNDDLKSTFPYPCTFTVVNAPRLTSSGSKLTMNPLFNGYSELSLSSATTSTLLTGKRDTIMFSVLLNPNGFYGTLKNSVVGFANTVNNQSVSDTSNNGFAWDPDNDGNPTNNNEFTFFDIELIELFIPEGFSPNDDGKFDFFEIKGLNGRRVNITIFNRWGNKVYVKENYDNSWDGKANVNGLLFGNNKLPESTYYYIVQFTDGNKEVKTGFVVLRY